MDLFNILCGLIGVIGFAFSIYTYYKGESKKLAEAARKAMVEEKLRNIKSNLIKTLYISDMMVQVPKTREVKVEEMQNLARVIRADLKQSTDYMDEELKKLENWQYGQLIKTNPQTLRGDEV